MKSKIENKVIGELILTQNSKLLISLNKIKGEYRIDVRLNVNNEKSHGVFFPTKKGINIPFNKLDELQSILKELNKYLVQ